MCRVKFGCFAEDAGGCFSGSRVLCCAVAVSLLSCLFRLGAGGLALLLTRRRRIAVALLPNKECALTIATEGSAHAIREYPKPTGSIVGFTIGRESQQFARFRALVRIGHGNTGECVGKRSGENNVIAHHAHPLRPASSASNAISGGKAAMTYATASRRVRLMLPFAFLQRTCALAGGRYRLGTRCRGELCAHRGQLSAF